MADRPLNPRLVKIWVRWIGVALVACLSAAFVTQTTSAGVLPDKLPQPARYENYLPILSDFDGDRRLDQAELHLVGTHHCIRVRFGNFREIHLDFGTRSLSGGVLLVRDVNSDNKPDLIWVYRSRSEPTLVWLSDGAGNFVKSSSGEAVNALCCDADYTVTATFGDEQTCLTAARPSFEFVAVAILDHDSAGAQLVTDHDSRLAAGLDLFCLRERGPPKHA